MYLRAFRNLGFELIKDKPDRHHILVDPPTELKLPGDTVLTDKSPELAADSVDMIIVSLQSRSLVRHSDRLVSHSSHAALYVPEGMKRSLGHSKRNRHLWEGQIEAETPDIKLEILGRPKDSGIARLVRTITHNLGSLVAGTIVKRHPLTLAFEGTNWMVQGRQFRSDTEVHEFFGISKEAHPDGAGYVLAFKLRDSHLATLCDSLPPAIIVLMLDPSCSEPIRNRVNATRHPVYRIPVNEWIDLDEDLEV